MKFRKAILAAALAGLGFAMSQSASAAIINGGFETGDFSGWSVLGANNKVIGDNVIAGTKSGLVSNWNGLSGTGVGTGAVADSTVETFLGLGAGAIDAFCTANIANCLNSATIGSAIKQSTSAQAGQTLTFNYKFLTNELTPSVFNDFAVLVFNGQQFLADTTSGPFTANVVAGGFTWNFGQTTVMSKSVMTTFAGVQTFGIYVMEEGDNIINSGIILDSFAGLAPEPGSLALLGIGLAGLGVGWRRRKPA